MKASYLISVFQCGSLTVVVALLGCATESGQSEVTTGPDFVVLPQRGYDMSAVGTWDFSDDPAAAGSDTASVTTNSATADQAALLGCAPNPFNPATVLSFAVPEAGGPVTIVIFSADGRTARHLLTASLSGGKHTVVWRGRDDSGRRLPSGTYLAQLNYSGVVQTSKLALLK